MEMNIYAYKCKRCGYVQYPYRTICGNCRENDHNEFDIVPLSKKGKLVTFTHLYALPADYNHAPANTLLWLHETLPRHMHYDTIDLLPIVHYDLPQ